MNSRSSAILFSVLAVLAALRPAAATVLAPVDVKELSRTAYAIVYGRVVIVRPQWTDGRRRIETLVTVEVRQYLKGNLGETVVFRVPGGELGRYRSVMVGAPAFREGEEVVLFLGAHGPLLPFLLGLGQGVFRLTRDPATAQPLVIPPPIGVAPAASGPVVRGAADRRPVPLVEFLRQVQALASASGRDGRDQALPRSPRVR